MNGESILNGVLKSERKQFKNDTTTFHFIHGPQFQLNIWAVEKKPVWAFTLETLVIAPTSRYKFYYSPLAISSSKELAA